MHMARALHRFGTPSDQLEYALSRMSARLGLTAQFLGTPTSVTASFGSGAQNHFYLVRHDQGDANLAKLSMLEQLAERVSIGEMSLTDADRAIDGILTGPNCYAPAYGVFAYAGASAAVARLFHGGWAEMLVAGGIGFLLGLLMLAVSRWPRFGNLLELCMAMCSAVLAAGCSRLLDGQLSQTTATLAGLIVLVPGLATTTALTELSTGNLVAGTSRLAGALVSFMKLGFGVAVGTRIGELLFSPGADVAAQVAPWSEWPAMVAAATSLAVILQVRRREVIYVLAVSAAGLAGLRLGDVLLGAELAPFLAAFVVTMCGNAYAKGLGRTASVVQVPAMLLLVPGSVGYRSLAALMHKDVLQGMQTAFAMGLNATALVAGALLAGLMMPPHKDTDD